MEGLSISAMSVGRRALSSQGPALARSRQLEASKYKLADGCCLSDDNNEADEHKYPEPTRMYRPKEWTPEVEEAFRIQQTGWRDISDYKAKYGEPERWENGFIRCTRVKASGYYTYWRQFRECDDKYLNKVKVYEYN
ncbi:hypothetical protein SDRG_10627 [Saprolegnia diclina VS20]|uniref:Uncharacterized protein n=1 Tax=Saprolegnia diclina (strain VS20) TaxID=1156394 RepID=T0Q1X2_SAPDV|nr:hypothetical protein SDRG_10627 [Saprolegnia diclina VS20]EQC31839.1 hypothetical protein SDRG_10627 [Saprolegnia diclina VS20]|eukprot:XP_008614846.1 hypothetical protein SDRG_10627 [Saprolegnia diclina VS20]